MNAQAYEFLVSSSVCWQIKVFVEDKWFYFCYSMRNWNAWLHISRIIVWLWVLKETQDLLFAVIYAWLHLLVIWLIPHTHTHTGALSFFLVGLQLTLGPSAMNQVRIRRRSSR